MITLAGISSRFFMDETYLSLKKRYILRGSSSSAKNQVLTEYQTAMQDYVQNTTDSMPYKEEIEDASLHKEAFLFGGRGETPSYFDTLQQLRFMHLLRSIVDHLFENKALEELDPEYLKRLRTLNWSQSQPIVEKPQKPELPRDDEAIEEMFSTNCKPQVLPDIDSLPGIASDSEMNRCIVCVSYDPIDLRFDEIRSRDADGRSASLISGETVPLEMIIPYRLVVQKLGIREKAILPYERETAGAIIESVSCMIIIVLIRLYHFMNSLSVPGIKLTSHPSSKPDLIAHLKRCFHYRMNTSQCDETKIERDDILTEQIQPTVIVLGAGPVGNLLAMKIKLRFQDTVNVIVIDLDGTSKGIGEAGLKYRGYSRRQTLLHNATYPEKHPLIALLLNILGTPHKQPISAIGAILYVMNLYSGVLYLFKDVAAKTYVFEDPTFLTELRCKIVLDATGGRANHEILIQAFADNENWLGKTEIIHMKNTVVRWYKDRNKYIVQRKTSEGDAFADDVPLQCTFQVMLGKKLSSDDITDIRRILPQSIKLKGMSEKDQRIDGVFELPEAMIKFYDEEADPEKAHTKALIRESIMSSLHVGSPEIILGNIFGYIKSFRVKFGALVHDCPYLYVGDSAIQDNYLEGRGLSKWFVLGNTVTKIIQRYSHKGWGE